MTFKRDAAGKLVRLGRVEQRATWNVAFGAGALPAWMTINLGTATYGVPSGSTEPVALAIASASNNVRLLGPQIYASQYEELEFTVKGLRFSANNGWRGLIGFGETSNDRGAMVIHENSASDSTAIVRGYLSSSSFDDHTTPFQLQKLNGGSQRPRNVSVIWRPRTGDVAILEDDQVVTTCVVAGVPTATAVRPLLACLATDATAKTLKFNTIELALRHN